MNKTAIAALGLLTLAVAGCTSTQPRGGLSTSELAVGDSQQMYARATQAERDRVVCRRDYQTGSNRPVRICTTLTQRNRMQQDAEGARTQLDNRPLPTGLPTGGPAG